MPSPCADARRHAGRPCSSGAVPATSCATPTAPQTGARRAAPCETTGAGFGSVAGRRGGTAGRGDGHARRRHQRGAGQVAVAHGGGGGVGGRSQGCARCPDRRTRSALRPSSPWPHRRRSPTRRRRPGCRAAPPTTTTSPTRGPRPSPRPGRRRWWPPAPRRRRSPPGSRSTKPAVGGASQRTWPSARAPSAPPGRRRPPCSASPAGRPVDDSRPRWSATRPWRSPARGGAGVGARPASPRSTRQLERDARGQQDHRRPQREASPHPASVVRAPAVSPAWRPGGGPPRRAAACGCGWRRA